MQYRLGIFIGVLFAAMLGLLIGASITLVVACLALFPFKTLAVGIAILLLSLIYSLFIRN